MLFHYHTIHLLKFKFNTMRKLLLCSLFLSFFSLTHAEKKVSEYYSSYFNETFDIEASAPKKGAFQFFIYCKSKDNHQTGFSIPSKDVPGFINSLNELKVKFVDWSKTAEENNIRDFDKSFGIKFRPVDTFFTYGNDRYLSHSVEMNPYFKVTENSDRLAIFNSSKLTASDNRFMTVAGFILVFKSVEDIDNLINALDMNAALKNKTRNSEIDRLFK